MTAEDKRRLYNSKDWQQLRVWVLWNEPLCRKCRERGLMVPASDCDHIRPLEIRPDLALDPDNIQPLCKSCHSKKTRIEEGAGGPGKIKYGRRKKQMNKKPRGRIINRKN